MGTYPPAPNPAHGGASSDSGIPFPRQCDTIAKDAHRTFLIAACLGVFAFITWSALVKLDTVTRGSGRIVPTQNNQMVQHFEGGIVSEILVGEGDRVKKGDILLRIENSFSRAEYSRAQLEMKAKQVQLARLLAESKGLTSIKVPPELEKQFPELVENERRLFKSRQVNLKEQLLILNDQVRQRELELAERNTRLTNITRERTLVSEQVESLKPLVKMGAVSKNDLLKNQTTLQRLETKISDLKYQIPKTRSSLSEVKRRRNEVILRFRSEAEKERTDVLLAIAKLKESVTALKDRKQRSDVRAPISGTVNKMFVTTIGGVVKSGQDLAQIVPADKSIAVEVKLSPKDRAEIWPGLPGVVKVSAYDYSIYGGLRGKITDISSDALKDEQGRPYFRVRLEATTSDFGKDKPVVPGMMAEVDILTGKHSILEYLVTPISKISEKALR